MSEQGSHLNTNRVLTVPDAPFEALKSALKEIPRATSSLSASPQDLKKSLQGSLLRDPQGNYYIDSSPREEPISLMPLNAPRLRLRARKTKRRWTSQHNVAIPDSLTGSLHIPDGLFSPLEIPRSVVSQDFTATRSRKYGVDLSRRPWLRWGYFLRSTPRRLCEEPAVIDSGATTSSTR
jgi:hypothetical protein